MENSGASPFVSILRALIAFLLRRRRRCMTIIRALLMRCSAAIRKGSQHASRSRTTNGSTWCLRSLSSKMPSWAWQCRSFRPNSPDCNNRQLHCQPLFNIININCDRHHHGLHEDPRLDPRGRWMHWSNRIHRIFRGLRGPHVPSICWERFWGPS